MSTDLRAALISEAVERYEPVATFALFSGGHDSLTSTAIAAQHPAFTSVVHINTGIGIEETREFVRETCKEQGWPLIELHSEHAYEDLVLTRGGFPSGPKSHSSMYWYLNRSRSMPSSERRSVSAATTWHWSLASVSRSLSAAWVRGSVSPSAVTITVAYGSTRSSTGLRLTVSITWRSRVYAAHPSWTCCTAPGSVCAVLWHGPRRFTRSTCGIPTPGSAFTTLEQRAVACGLKHTRWADRRAWGRRCAAHPADVCIL